VLLRLNRPEVGNAVNASLAAALAAEVAALETRDDVRAVLLTGAGARAFCSGGDLRWMRQLRSPADGAAMSRRMKAILGRLSALPMPVIGVLQAPALGGGAELALACDIRVLAADAWMCFKQVRMGLTTGWGGGARLREAVGAARALELLATGRRIPAAEAQSLGLVQRVSADPLAAASEIADAIAAGAPRAVRAVKTLLRGGGTEPLETALLQTLWGAADHQEAVTAFFDKRPPRWR